MVVPMFSPNTSAAAVSKGMTPLEASEIVIASVADDDCTTIVTTPPTIAHFDKPN